MPTAPLPAPKRVDSPAVRGQALVESLARPREIPSSQRIHVNRNLRLDQIHTVGFDMDYTLALYDQARMEDLSARETISKLISVKGYPAQIQGLTYDPKLAIRGLVVDHQTGNIFKPDRYAIPGRILHGKTPLPSERVTELYHREPMRLADRRYAWIDTLFALPEAVLYMNLVEFFDGYSGSKPNYDQLWHDIRECIDLAHRDGSIKTLIAANVPNFIERDPTLAEALHRFRSAGKRLFLLTNSEWTYTDPVMRYLLDDALPAYPSWRHYFDIVIVSACKPTFFTEDRPFVQLKADGEPMAKSPGGPFSRSQVYAGGNLREFEERARTNGADVLYIGDHIYGDMLRSRKSSAWRTAMVLQELEHEVQTHGEVADDLSRLDDLELELRNLEGEIGDCQMVLRALQKLESESSADGLDSAKRNVKEGLDRLRETLRASREEHRQLERQLDVVFNPHWGPLFREGYEITKFGEQVASYACVYTSRVSNFRYYSPNCHFRGARDRMPHER